MSNDSGLKLCICGDDELALTIATTIQTSPHQLLLVISYSHHLSQWCQQQSIPYVNHDQNFELPESDFVILANRNQRHQLQSLYDKEDGRYIQYFEGNMPCDYKQTRIPEILINKEEELSFCWALVNQSKQHYLLDKTTFKLSSPETAATLTSKSIYSANLALTKILEQLAAKKDLSSINYKALAKQTNKPLTGIIDWTQSAEFNLNLFQALDFQQFYNPYAKLKLQIDQHWYYIDELQFQETTQPYSAGQIIQINDTDISVACRSNAISLSKICDLDGEHINIKKLSERHQLSAGKVLANLSNQDRQLIANTLNTTNTDETDLLPLLTQQASSCPYFDSNSSKPTIPQVLSVPLDTAFLAQFGSSFSIATIKLALSTGYLFCLTQKPHWLCGFHNPALNEVISSSLLNNCIPALFSIDANSNLFELCQSSQRLLEKSSHAYFSKDIAARSNIAATIDKRWLQQRAPIQFYLDCLDSQPQSHHGLIFYIDDKPELKISYNTSLLNNHDKQFICNQINSHFQLLIQQFLTNPAVTMDKLTLLSETDLQTIANINDTHKAIPESDLIIKLFKQQVDDHPQHFAVSDQTQQITYKDLDIASDKLACYLQDKGISTDSIVAIYFNHSIELIIAILASIKAGCAYTPIDPKLPQNRIDFILSDTQAEIILTSANENHLQTHLQKVLVETFLNDDIKHCKPALKHNSHDAAYVIYTSGSTGQPKGVKIKRINLLNLIYWNIDTYHLTHDSQTTLLAGVGFDASVWEIFPSLCAGACLHITPRNIVTHPKKLIDWLYQKKIDTTFLPTPIVNLILKSDITALKRPINILTGGDRLNRYTKKIENLSLFNQYGPTENTVVTTQQEVHAEDETERFPAIGKPILNSQTFIANKTIVPVGITAEIMISGNSLFSGYLNRQQETQNAFAEITFNNQHFKAYKSGDLGRFLPNGAIDYVKRKDRQIKIRGFRVELAEIEKRLTEYEYIEHAVVIDEKLNDTIHVLNAYIVPKITPNAFDIELLKNHLKQYLPDYMIPSTFIIADELPLTPNQKVDKNKLLAMLADKKSESAKALSKTAYELTELLANLLKINPGSFKIDTDFFAIGIDSISATTLAWTISEKLLCHCSIETIYQYNTIQKLAEFIDNSKNSQAMIPIIKPLHKKSAPLSYEQQALWSHYKMYPQACCYNITLYWDISAHSNLKQLESALQSLIEQHTILRCNFRETPDLQHEQFVNQHSIELTKLNAEQPITQIIEDFTRRPFNLECDLLIRAGIIPHHNKLRFLVCIHHIIFDGWSLDIFSQLLSTLYNQQTIPTPTIDFLDYSYWQQSEELQTIYQKRLPYWKQQLQQCNMIDFPNRHNSNHQHNGDTFHCSIDQKTTVMLTNLAKSSGTTLFNVLLSAYMVLIHRQFNQDDFFVGCINFNRSQPQLKDVLGYFANIIPIRAQINKPLLTDFINQQHQQLQQSFEQALPYSWLIDKLDAHGSIINSLFTYQLETDIRLDLDGQLSSQNQVYYADSKLDLSLSIKRDNDTLIISAEYSNACFNRDSIRQLLSSYQFVLSEFAQSLHKKINYIDIISPSQRQLLQTFEKGQVTTIPEMTIDELFSENTTLEPDKTALIYGDQHFSYQQLNNAINAAAEIIATTSPQHEEVIAILANRNAKLIVAIFAILKTGAAFTIIRDDLPKAAIKTMLDDANSRLIINCSDKTIVTELSEYQILNIDPNAESQQQQLQRHTPTSLAYIAYTSGSTGKPKGAMIEHQSVINMARLMRRHCQERILCFSALGFDGILAEIFMSLLNGLTLVIANEGNLLPGKPLTAAILKYQVDTLIITPSALAVTPVIKNSTLQNMFVVGEAFSNHLIKPWLNTSVNVINAYGPAETAVCVTMQPCQIDQPLYIGKPDHNFRIYLLDDKLQRVAVGAVGEIFIAGIGVGRGYINNPEQNKIAFINNPYDDDPNYSRLYRTGDLARWHSFGLLEYIARNDTQIKLHGMRIEAKEIEVALLQHPKIKQAFVCKQTFDNNDYLSAYYCSTEKNALQQSELRHFLNQSLPYFKVPQYFIELDELPLSANGKVDRKRLPLPEISVIDDEYIAPQNNTESKLQNIWQTIFKQTTISIEANFFELGGHSILAVQLIEHIEKQFQQTLQFQDIITAPTINAQAQLLTQTYAQPVNDIITLKSNGNKTPLFLIHPVGGTIFWYLHYSRYLDDRPLYAIQDPGINNPDYHIDSLDEAADHYYDLIKSIQPQGPYLLGGASSGSNIAAKICHRLERQGEQVLALVALDGWTLYPKQLNDQDFLTQVLKQQFTTLEQQLQQHQIKDSQKWLQLQLLRGKLMQHYQPQIINAPLILLKATELLPIFKDGDAFDNYWSRFVNNNLLIEQVPGDHETMHYSPNCQTLIEKLNDAFKQLNI